MRHYSQAKGVERMLMEALAASVSVGLGCGTCCGSSASSFLTVYILTEGGGFKSSMKHVGSYFLGKILAVCAICALTSAIGKVFIDDNGMIGGFNLHHLVSDLSVVSQSQTRLQKMRRQVLCKAQDSPDPILLCRAGLRRLSVCSADDGSRLRDVVVAACGCFARRRVCTGKLPDAHAGCFRLIGSAQRQDQQTARQGDAVCAVNGIYPVFDPCSRIAVLV